MNNDSPILTAPRAEAKAASKPPDKPVGLGSNGLPVGARLREFEVVRLIGEGGFGIVYLAEDHVLGRQVALKEFMPASLATRRPDLTVSVRASQEEPFQLGLKSFINEARLLAQFDHPSLVRVYQFWEANGTAYMVMPFYRGTTLSKFLRDRRMHTNGPPDEVWLRGLLMPLLEALDTIHAAQCYHRDIAPDNILLLEDSGRPLLLDFGSARRVIGDVTHALTAFVKPGFAPIEQYAQDDSMRQGPWTDIYALAATLYFAITGEVPVNSTTRILGDQQPSLYKRMKGSYSDAFLQAIDLGLAVRPQHRLQSVATWRALAASNLKLSGTGPQQILLEETTPPTGPPRVPTGGQVQRPSSPARPAVPATRTHTPHRTTTGPTAQAAPGRTLGPSAARASSYTTGYPSEGAEEPDSHGPGASHDEPGSLTPDDLVPRRVTVPPEGVTAVAPSSPARTGPPAGAESAGDPAAIPKTSPASRRTVLHRWALPALFAAAAVLLGASVWFGFKHTSTAAQRAGGKDLAGSNSVGGAPAAASNGSENGRNGEALAPGAAGAAVPAVPFVRNCDVILRRAANGERISEAELNFLETNCEE